MKDEKNGIVETFFTEFEVAMKDFIGIHLRLSCDTTNLEEVRKAVEESQKRSVSKGFKPVEWSIIKVETHTVRTDSGEFIRSEVVRTKVEDFLLTTD